MDQHYAPYTLQYLRLNDYLAGYLHGRVLFSAPQVFRTVAGNLVRLFVYQPTGVGVQWSAVEAALARVFGQYQGPGTSGRAPDDNEREGRVKTRLEVVSLASPLLNADILAQYVGR